MELNQVSDLSHQAYTQILIQQDLICRYIYQGFKHTPTDVVGDTVEYKCHNYKTKVVNKYLPPFPTSRL